MSTVLPIPPQYQLLEEMCDTQANILFLNIICHKNTLFRTPQAFLEIYPNVDMFKLNHERIIKRISQLPTIEGGPARTFIILSSDKVLKNILLSSTKGVMDATFKVQHKLCCLYNKC